MARRPDKFRTFDQDIRMATAGIAPERIAAELARFAKSERDRLIADRQASPMFDTFVNGVRGAAEEAVKPPGPIVYVFSYWQPVIEFTLAALRRRGPRLSGDYEASHMVMIGGQVIRPDTPISADEEVTIVATVPYARKIEVGHMRMSVERGVYQDVAQMVRSRFGGTTGAFDARYRPIEIPGGYILKGRFTRGFRKHARRDLKRDTRAGARMTYPAIIMSMKG